MACTAFTQALYVLVWNSLEKNIAWQTPIPGFDNSGFPENLKLFQE